jgi:uncharacterized LabA/DUF88 family protein/GNAT superfamily N-acetyltransferase
MDKNNAIMYKF